MGGGGGARRSGASNHTFFGRLSPTDAQKQLEYRVRWQDARAGATYTWEPAAHAVHADRLVYEYWAHFQGQPPDVARAFVAALHEPSESLALALQEHAAVCPWPPPGAASGASSQHTSYSSIKDDMPEGEKDARVRYDALPHWDPIAQKITSMSMVHGTLHGHILFADGTTLMYPHTVLNERCPQAMLLFYERHVRFYAGEKDVPPPPSSSQ